MVGARIRSCEDLVGGLASHVIHHDIDVISDAPHSLTETLALAAEEKAARSSTIRIVGGHPFICVGDPNRMTGIAGPAAGFTTSSPERGEGERVR